jgi:hypothetical protein
MIEKNEKTSPMERREEKMQFKVYDSVSYRAGSNTIASDLTGKEEEKRRINKKGDELLKRLENNLPDKWDAHLIAKGSKGGFYCYLIIVIFPKGNEEKAKKFILNHALKIQIIGIKIED